MDLRDIPAPEQRAIWNIRGSDKIHLLYVPNIDHEGESPMAKGQKTDYKLERITAIGAVLKACRLCTSVRDTYSAGDTIEKDDRSPATVADYGAQALVIAELLTAFPADAIVAEEDAGDLQISENADIKAKVFAEIRRLKPMEDGEIIDAIAYGKHDPEFAERYWALDPLDGTKGFLRGEQFAVALALIEDGKIALGVLGCPNLPFDYGKADSRTGCIFIAVKGQGAFVRNFGTATESSIHTDNTIDETQITLCESFESGHSSHDASARIMKIMRVKKAPIRMDSQCKYAAVARGEASGYLRLPTKSDYEEKVWDHAAGSILVTEAGGSVTDIKGNHLDFSLGRTLRANRGVIATNGAIHQKLLEFIRKAQVY